MMDPSGRPPDAVEPVPPSGSDPAVSVTFDNGNRAILVRARPRQAATTLIEAAGIAAPSPVLLIVGGADGLDPSAATSIRRLFERGVAGALETTGAVVVDGGTATGIMAIAGEVLGGAGLPLTLVGVAPAGRVSVPGDIASPGVAPAASLEPNHSHLILAASDEWGGETRLLLEIVEAIAGPRPVVVLLVGGGDVTRREVLGATARGWPIVVLAGTGGLADALVAAVDPHPAEPAADLPDPSLASVAGQAVVTVVAPDADPAILERGLLRRLQPDATLVMAWQRYHVLSLTARQQQRSFRRLQRSILGLGVLVTVLVVLQVALPRRGLLAPGEPGAVALHYAIVIVPITVAVLFAMAARLRPGSRWVQLRGTAETIKREIFRYRARAGRYAPARSRVASREVKLTDAVGSAMSALMQTEVNLSAFDDRRPADPAVGHTADGDDGYRPLTPETYIKYRIDDQIAYYERGVARRERQVIALRWIMLLVGGLGTLLAAALLEPWVAVTTAVVGAVATYLEAMQIESTIMLQNQAATDLGTVRAWWNALSPEEQLQPRRVDQLVNHAERVMGAEHSGWIQEMRDAITQLRLESAEDTRRAGAGHEPDEPIDDEPAEEAPVGGTAVTSTRVAGGRRSGARATRTRTEHPPSRK
jgi:hypothetical protein